MRQRKKGGVLRKEKRIEGDREKERERQTVPVKEEKSSFEQEAERELWV